MPADTLADLIRRLEEATGPDRRLDAEIGAWRCSPDAYALDDEPGFYRVPGCGSISSTSQRAAPYTSSVDAALLLVPEGACFDSLIRAYQPDMGGKQWQAAIRFSGRKIARGRTAPLAICLACLKARLPDAA